MSKEYDYAFKILIIGESTVGKTSILISFSEGTFTYNYISTVGKFLSLHGDLLCLDLRTSPYL